MLIKNFLLKMYLCFFNPYLIYLIFFYITLYYFFYTNNIKIKLFFFFLIIILLSIWGFMFDLDGIIFLFLLNEFVLIFFFIIMYTQTYNYKLKKKQVQNITLMASWYLIFFSFLILYFYFKVISIFNIVYYDLYNYIGIITSNDFFILYRFFFIDFLFISFCIIFVLSFFSIFFILFYFSCKDLKIKNTEKKKTIKILKKQSLFFQSQHKSMIRCFK